MIKRILQLITLLLLLLVAYWVYRGYVQEVVIFNSGSDNNGSGKFNININMEFSDALKFTSWGLGAAAIIKACPPNTRPSLALGYGLIGLGYSLGSEYLKFRNSGNPSGGSGSIIISTNQGKYNGSTSSGESSKGVNKCIDGLSDVFILIKEKIMGSPINCEGSSWNPMDNINELLMGFSEEEKFFIGIILLLSVALYTSIGIMISVITRLIFNKPFKNKYLEKLRILWSQSNNLTLIALFTMQSFGIIYSIYALCVYIGFIYYS